LDCFYRPDQCLVFGNLSQVPQAKGATGVSTSLGGHRDGDRLIEAGPNILQEVLDNDLGVCSVHGGVSFEATMDALLRQNRQSAEGAGATQCTHEVQWVLGDPLDQCPQQPYRVDADGPRNRHKFNDIHAALATLVFGHERLGFSELPGQLLLGQAGFLARLHQQGAESLVLRRTEGL
jgi:hypothetical protein